jgi:hypothetical protein
VGAVDSVQKPPAVLAPEHDDRRKLLAILERINIGRSPIPVAADDRSIGDRVEWYLDQPVAGCLGVEPFFPQSVLKVRIAVEENRAARYGTECC